MVTMPSAPDPAATAAQMDAQGWFYTGDLGRLDGEGWLTFEGRSKDIINRGGEKFSAPSFRRSLHGDNYKCI